MSIIDFVDSLRNEIYHPDISVKEIALKKLSDYVASMPFYNTDSATIECLLQFYLSLFGDHYSILDVILTGILNLINFKSFSDSHAKLVASSIVRIDISQLKTPIRLSAFMILENLFLYHANGMSLLNNEFIREYMTAVSGESDPQCVVYVMRINTLVTKTLRIDDIYEELFESISVYFPVEFKAKKNSNLTREQVVEANKASMLASSLFGTQLFATLLDKLRSDMKSARMDSMDILVDAFALMDFKDVLNYYMSFQTLLYHEYKNRDPEIQRMVTKCLNALSTQFQTKSTETELLEFSFHLFELCYSVISNDEDCLSFVLIAITKQPRIWCAYAAYFLEKIAEKLIHENLEDLERLNVLIAILSAHDNLSQYKGLVDKVNCKHVFTKATLLYHQINDLSTNTENNKKITVLFRLLALYSLFNVTVPQSGSSANCINDRSMVLESQVLLVSKAINQASVCDNNELEEALIKLVPQMVAISITEDGVDNKLIRLILQLSDSDGPQSEISFHILRSLPTSCLELVLNQCCKNVNGNRLRESASSCLAVLAERFRDDSNSCDQIYCTIADLIENRLGSLEDLSVKNVENLAITIAQLGTMSDERSKNRILDFLIAAIRRTETNDATVFFLCAILGRSNIETINESIKTTDLLNLLFGLLFVIDDAQIHALVAQTYASLVNKSGPDKDVEELLLNILPLVKSDGLFLLCLLKACVHSSHKTIVNTVIALITDPEYLRSDVAKSLSQNIEILSTNSISKNRHFCTDDALYKNQAMFYEQQIYFLLAQKYQQLSITDEIGNKIVQDMAIELYLKLVSGFSNEVLELSLDEVIETIVRSLPLLSISADKVDLQVQVLKSLSHLRVDTVVHSLKSHIDDISKIIVSVAEHSTTLSVDDKESLAKAITWFIGDLLTADTVAGHGDIIMIINRMLQDKKRVVRVEINKARRLMEEYETME